MTVELETLEAVVVKNAETGKLDLFHPACAGGVEPVDGPPVMVEREPQPPSCAACGKPFERSKVIHAPTSGKITRLVQDDEGDDGPTMH